MAVSSFYVCSRENAYCLQSLKVLLSSFIELAALWRYALIVILNRQGTKQFYILQKPLKAARHEHQHNVEEEKRVCTKGAEGDFHHEA